MSPDKELKAKLVRVAVKLLKKTPAEVLSLREVARASGVSQAAPYRHFEDKEGLLAAIAAEGFLLLRQCLLETVSKYASPSAQFLGMGMGYVKFGQEHPEHLKLMFGPFVSPGPQHPELFRNAKLSFLSLVSLVQSCQKAGVVGAGDPFQRAMHVWMAMHGFTVLFVAHRCDWLGLTAETFAPRVEAFCADLLQGMKGPLPVSRPEHRLQVMTIPTELLIEAGVEFEMSFEKKPD